MSGSPSHAGSHVLATSASVEGSNRMNTFHRNANVSSPEPYDDINFRGLLDVVLEARWLILAITSLVLLAGAAYAYLSPPIYRADTLIQVEQTQGTANNMLDQLANVFNVQTPASAEMEILRSRLVVGQAADALQLYVTAHPKYLPVVGSWLASRATQLTEPGLLGFGGYVWGTESIQVEQLTVPPGLEGQHFMLRTTETGYELLVPGHGKVVEGKTGTLSKFHIDGQPAAILVNSLHAEPGAEFAIVRRSRLNVIQDLQDSLAIAEKGKPSGVLSISLEGTNPTHITQILNAVGAAYVRQNIERRSAEAEKSLAFLNDFLPQLKQQMEESERKYTQFRDRHGTFDLTTQGTLTLNTSASLQTQLLELEQKYRDLSSRFAPAHPSVRVIEEQISAVKDEIAKLAGRIKTLPDLEQQLLTLVRDVKVNGELYASLLNSAQQLRLIKEGKVGNVRVVDTAALPQQAIKPNRPLAMTIASILGLALGIGVALLRNMLRTGIRHPGEIESHLGLPVFAAIPHSAPQVKLQSLIQEHVSGKHLLVNTASQDPAIESLRSLRTALQFAMQEAPNNIVLLTSPTPNTGKSFVSVNFAAVLGAAGKRVLLIDADLRRGHINQYFGLERRGGLSELASGRLSLEQALRESVMPNLDLITSGTLPPNPAELLQSEPVAQILEKASAQYDVVLLDCAPILAVSDAMALAPQAGTVFLLARTRISTIAELEESAKRLRQVGADARGVLLNDLSLNSRGYGAPLYPYSNYGA